MHPDQPSPPPYNPGGPVNPPKPTPLPLGDPLLPLREPKPSRLPWIVAIAAGAGFMILAVIVAAMLVYGTRASGLSEEVAQRECRTAIEREGKMRADRINDEDTGILVTVKRVEAEPAYRTETGWRVDGTVTVTHTGTLIAQTEQAVGLSCTATGEDGAVRTTVANR